MVELGVLSMGVSGYLFLLCVLCGMYLLIIDARSSSVSGKDQAVSKAFGWIHLALSVVILLMLWLM